jgi:adenylate kinase family enzyme
MKFIIIFGPHAVGKMTVGQELEKLTGIKLFHNHISIDFVAPFFSYGTKAGQRLVSMIREGIFTEVAKIIKKRFDF